MSTQIQTPFGTALPPAQRHAITVHIPAWESVVRFTKQDPELFKQLKSMYPRFVLHKDIMKLSHKLLKFAGLEGHECYIFPSLQAARDCVDYSTSSNRGRGKIVGDKIMIRAYKTYAPLYAVIFPVESTPTVHGFWLNSGPGISSRLAEDSLKHFDSLQEFEAGTGLSCQHEGPAHAQIKDRIAGLLNRAPIDPSRTAKVTPTDIYFFTTGMSSIYWVHRYLLSKYKSSSVLFGFSFHSTIHVLEDFGPGVEFLGLGNSSELLKLSQHLASRRQQGKKVQAIWAEFPSNPLLNTPSLQRLRQLADEHGTLLIIDDTIGSFCNVDVLSVADIVVSSLTKSFSGYADLMAGCAILSPLSKHYSELKTLFDREHHNDLYIRDAEQLELNSRDYLERSAILNNNALKLVGYLQSKALDPSSTVKAVYYPTTTPGSLENYTPFMRPPTPSFPSPGYGCLFSIEFTSQASTISFYDNLHVHHGPHLGAHLTIALAYSMGIYGNELEWAAKYNIRPEQVRISVGLEDTEMLFGVFRHAVDVADGKVNGHVGQKVLGAKI